MYYIKLKRHKNSKSINTIFIVYNTNLLIRTIKNIELISQMK